MIGRWVVHREEEEDLHVVMKRDGQEVKVSLRNSTLHSRDDVGETDGDTVMTSRLLMSVLPVESRLVDLHPPPANR